MINCTPHNLDTCLKSRDDYTKNDGLLRDALCQIAKISAQYLPHSVKPEVDEYVKLLITRILNRALLTEHEMVGDAIRASLKYNLAAEADKL